MTSRKDRLWVSALRVNMLASLSTMGFCTRVLCSQLHSLARGDSLTGSQAARKESWVQFDAVHGRSRSPPGMPPRQTRPGGPVLARSMCLGHLHAITLLVLGLGTEACVDGRTEQCVCGIGFVLLRL